MEALERQVKAPVGFVAAKAGGMAGNIPRGGEEDEVREAEQANPEEIDLDMMEE